jgi:protein O-GlcNAc transferase
MPQPAIQQMFDQALKLQQTGKMREAELLCRQILARDPNHAETLHLLGTIAYQAGHSDAALDLLRRSIAIKPNRTSAQSNLGSILKSKGMVSEAVAAYRKAIELSPEDASIDSNLVYTMLFDPDFDAQSLARELQRWNTAHAKPLARFIAPHTNDRNPDRKLRIGYVSPDLRDHVIGRNLLPMFRHHDREQFEIFCYAHVLGPDAMTEEFKQMSTSWRNIVKMPDEQLAKQIREDRIDILLDLALHMAKNRLLVFARKPAPVQATFAGYPGSTGLETIDYRLTDPYLDPPEMDESVYSEKSFRLPHSFWCYDPLGANVPVSALPAQSKGYVTFGCLSNFCKTNERVVTLWGQVLKSMDRSRLAILCPPGNHRQRLLDWLARDGVTVDRVEFITHRPRFEYLAAYQHIDIGLDTLPYNGHSTSLDSFWMGVPVVTLAGKTVMGRAGVSQLMNLGSGELIAKTPEQFVQIATGLAKDLPRLADIRRTLRSRMEKSPLMDTIGFTRGIEAAYRQMWQNWCK